MFKTKTSIPMASKIMRDNPESVPIAWAGSAFYLALSTPVFNCLARCGS